MNTSRNTIDRTDKPLPNISLGTPLERLKRASSELAFAIELGDRSLYHNRITAVRLAINDYDKSRFGEAELPF
jgi:hypothetical protein